MKPTWTTQFRLRADELGVVVDVELRRGAGRWVARVAGPTVVTALGATAPSALTAALEPLGDRVARILLADLTLLEPSVRVVELERAAGA